MASESEAQRALQYEQTLVSTGGTERARGTGVAQDATGCDRTPEGLWGSGGAALLRAAELRGALFGVLSPVWDVTLSLTMAVEEPS